MAGCAMVGDDVAITTNQVARNPPGITASHGADARGDERRAEAENRGGLRQIRSID